ncbi:hypothetical protein HPG69_007238 [Diceros bicornis minor]|uniref:Uncharacterized protein n=1 Tax=Diceros bicornis minor TaxID=77932 RepID=A0A7J7FP62_DICBM|nr:hypothetical protein HPG69_007238 [Diceros bicornis minor]
MWGLWETMVCHTNLHQHQRQCVGEKPYRSDEDRASFVKNCKCHVLGKPFIFRMVGENFLAISEFLQQRTSPTRESILLSWLKYLRVP